MVARWRLILWRWVTRIHDELHAAPVGVDEKVGLFPSVWSASVTGLDGVDGAYYDTANYEWDVGD